MTSFAWGYTAKAERLRQAREEAEKEAAAYRQQREEHFARQLQAVRPLCVACSGRSSPVSIA
eukprot:scaffold7694_cov430-Prasinococcus_capsulatus_cf.AAC.4